MPDQYSAFRSHLTTPQQLIESLGWGDSALWSDYQQDGQDAPTARGFMSFDSLWDREDGRNYPIYSTEQDLSMQRAMSRRLISLNELTESVSTALKVYVFGQGVEISVQSAKGMQPPPELVDDVRRFVETFSEQNNLVNNLDVEIDKRSRDDGEAILPIERVGNKIVCDFVEAIQLTEPRNPQALHEWINAKCGIDCDSFVPSWMFGVLTQKKRTSWPLAYHIINDNSGDFDIYTAEECVHVKRNVLRACKRGVSDWLAVYDRIQRASKLARNMAHGAALQSAIAWIEQWVQGAGNPPARGQGTSQDGSESNGRNGSRNAQSKSYKEGSIIQVGYGKEFKTGPLGAERNNGFTLVEQMLERLVAIRWLMPYQLISGDYSNNNFSSSLTAESPFVKAREADQQFYGGIIKSLLWKVIRMAWRLGWLDTRGLRVEDLERWIDIKVDFTSPASRDKLQLVQQLTAEIQNLGLSKRTALTEMGRDPDEEAAARERDGDQPMATGDSTQQLPGVLSGLGARQINNTRSVQMKILNDYKDGKIGRVVAKGQLLAASVDDATAESYLQDVDDNGQIDNPAMAAAVKGALESVETTEEARQILEEIYP